MWWLGYPLMERWRGQPARSPLLYQGRKVARGGITRAPEAKALWGRSLTQWPVGTPEGRGWREGAWAWKETTTTSRTFAEGRERERNNLTFPLLLPSGLLRVPHSCPDFSEGRWWGNRPMPFSVWRAERGKVRAWIRGPTCEWLWGWERPRAWKAFLGLCNSEGSLGTRRAHWLQRKWA